MSGSKIAAYRIIRQAWQNPGSGCDTIECHNEDGTITEEAHHPSTWWWNESRFKEAKSLPARTA